TGPTTTTMFSLLTRQLPRLWTTQGHTLSLKNPIKSYAMNLWNTSTNKPNLGLSAAPGYLGGIRTKKYKAKKDEERTPLVRTDGKFKTFKPITPGLRFRRYPLRDHLWKGKPMRKLTIAKRKTGGRNNTGRITVRHIGGGHRQRIRLVDFNRYEPYPCEVVRLEYDPGRSAHIALIRNFKSGNYSYIVAPQDLTPGMIVESFRTPKERTPEEIEEEQRLGGLPASYRSTDGPAQIVRSAGNWAQLVSTGQVGYAQVRLPSGETRKVPVDAICTIGKVSNPDHQHRVLGKAGVSRHLGIRPSVRGVAMNPCDHPHGGGRGKSGVVIIRSLPGVCSLRAAKPANVLILWWLCLARVVSRYLDSY
ncbi:mitochondrial 54S ribosomal protein rml2, partial [Massospora cicadina]